jgi:hypothetical protein
MPARILNIRIFGDAPNAQVDNLCLNLYILRFNAENHIFTLGPLGFFLAAGRQ